MGVFRCPECGYAESTAGRRPARCPDCGRPAGPPPDDSSGTNVLVWLGVGALVLVLLFAIGAGVAGYLAFRAGRSATSGMVAAVTPPGNATDALAGLQDPGMIRVELALGYLKSAPVDPALQPQIAAELERHLSGPHAWGAADALVNWAMPKQVPALIQSAQAGDGPVRSAAYKALVRLRDPRGVPVFARGLTDQLARHDAAEALIAIGPAAETDVVPFVTHPDVFTRMEANRVMERIGTPKSLPALEAAEARFRNSGVPADLTAATMLNHTIRMIRSRGR
jgi:hypothetical protein